MSGQFPISSDHSSLLNITTTPQGHHLSTLLGRGSGWAFAHLVPVFISLVHLILFAYLELLHGLLAVMLHDHAIFLQVKVPELTFLFVCYSTFKLLLFTNGYYANNYLFILICSI